MANALTAERWQRVKTILADALERPTREERTRFVRETCDGDTELLLAVEEFLAQTGGNLDDCADHTPVSLARDRSSQLVATKIGAYEIVREIGRGGMGAVYLANRADGQFEKQVAIKLLKRGTDTDEILRRFRAERRILARLDHPNIARLLDAGTTEDGLPYFVMEYVDGVPINIFARKNDLSVRDRLELFVTVCAAVQLAHQNLVVHRDLKPTNILVRADGEPKLLDFGIAKLLGPSDTTLLLTVTEQRRLTPAFASPEQARGEAVTTVSDVYALGALLYELLTEKTPHRFSTLHPAMEELARVIGEQEPIRPSLATATESRRRSLRGDLDNIVLLALRKEPARRYKSVAAFAEDIQRYLDGRPVHARPHTAAYLSRRFIGRHKLGVAIAVITLLAAVAISATFIWQASRAAERSAILRGETKSALADFQLHWRAGNSTAALDDSQRALKALHELAVTAPNDRQLKEAEGYAYQCEAIAQRAIGDIPSAAKTYARAEGVYSALIRNDPNNPSYLDLLRQTKQEHQRLSSVTNPK